MKTFACALVLALIIGPPVTGEKYEIDPAHAFVNFSIAHFAGKAHGSFDDVRGTILFDETDITRSSVTVVIKTASIHTGNTNRDNHLRSDDFFAAEKHPEATFKSTRVEKKDAKLIAIGELTIRGVTREVSMPFTIAGPMKDPLPAGAKRLMVQASLKFDRRDFGISWSRVTDTGQLFVGNEVSLEINVEAIVPKVNR